MLVMFTQDASTLAELKPLEAQAWAPEAFAAGAPQPGRVLPGGIIDSRLGKAVGKLLKERGTARNWATVKKLQAMVLAED
jgi:uncharacterized protein (DUF1697 family)